MLYDASVAFQKIVATLEMRTAEGSIDVSAGSKQAAGSSLMFSCQCKSEQNHKLPFGHWLEKLNGFRRESIDRTE